MINCQRPVSLFSLALSERSLRTREMYVGLPRTLDQRNDDERPLLLRIYLDWLIVEYYVLYFLYYNEIGCGKDEKEYQVHLLNIPSSNRLMKISSMMR